MLAVFNSLYANNFAIFEPILMKLVSNSGFIEFFLIKHTYYRILVPFNEGLPIKMTREKFHRK